MAQDLYSKLNSPEAAAAAIIRMTTIAMTTKNAIDTQNHTTAPVELVFGLFA